MTVIELIDYLEQLRADGLGGATVVISAEDGLPPAGGAHVEMEWILRSSGV